jgi:hypothetical protein
MDMLDRDPLLESRKLLVAEVRHLFRVPPPHVIGLVDSEERNV